VVRGHRCTSDRLLEHPRDLVPSNLLAVSGFRVFYHYVDSMLRQELNDLFDDDFRSVVPKR
jgi:hypothetical protein